MDILEPEKMQLKNAHLWLIQWNIQDSLLEVKENAGAFMETTISCMAQFHVALVTEKEVTAKLMFISSS